jgi:hypothetical protein
MTRAVSDSSVTERPVEESNASVLPALPFRATPEKDENDTPQAFFRAHYNQENQTAFRRKNIGIRRKRHVALLNEDMNHFDPQEKSSFPPYAGNTMSPMFMSLPEPADVTETKTAATVSAKAGPDALSTPKNAHTRALVGEVKTGSDASPESSSMRTIERLESKSRLNCQAKAA